MLSTLIESKRTRSRSRGAEAASVIIHAVVISLVAAVTAQANDHTPRVQPPHPERVYYEPVQPKTPAAPAISQVPETPSVALLPKVVYKTIEMPLDIPTGIPPVDLSLPPIDPSALAGASPPHRDASGYGRPTPDAGTGAYSAWQVEKTVVPLSGNPKPEYPSVLQSAGVEGEVLAQFVVDTTGLVDMSTFRVLKSTNDLFVHSVRRALSTWRFLPAEAGGARVKQLVQMPLTFRVR
jgi:protein TonB